MTNEVMLRDSDILNPEYSFDSKIEVATKVAKSLNKVIEDQNLAITIGRNGSKYVTASGWSVLGTMLGCTSYVESVEEVPTSAKGSFMYKATVSIRKGDVVLSRVEAIAERNNMQSDRPSVYSMAQTRAIGKAYRLALAWIVEMAGYEPTPAEEMQHVYAKQKRSEAWANAKAKTKKEVDVVEAEIVDVTPESATVVDNGDDVLKIVEELCQDIKATGSPCRKAKLLQLAKKQGLSEDVINHIKGLNNEDLKKYDE